MNHQIYKIYNQEDFNRITKGIKVAQCMQSKSTSVSDTEKILGQLDELVVSDSLSCSFCNIVFEDQAKQRVHYKSDWHCYNLKQRLYGLKSISEDDFGLLADKDDVSSTPGTESESENEEEMCTSDTGSSPNGNSSSKESGTKTSPTSIDNKNRRQENNNKAVEFTSDSSDTENDEEVLKKKKNLLVVASRHSKIFFENEEGNIFSIYRCLLHNKKEVPEEDNEIIAQALESGKRTNWTVIMLGGGHVAAAVFQGGEAVVHKTFHSYTVRAKQGGAQCSRDMRTMGSHPKSAGANLRRYNRASLIQHVQEILESWSTEIANSSLILYRAVGPYNRSVLFGGKNPSLDKNDSRLRPVPFPTARATFSEVKRVYDILSTMEIYGSAAQFTDCFPISPRQPIRKKVLKVDVEETSEKILDDKSNPNPGTDGVSEVQNNEKTKNSLQTTPERQYRSPRSHIDRAKPRKSPRRPLPDIVARLAQSSSGSETDEKEECSSGNIMDIPLIHENFEIEFNDHLQAFQDTVPRYMKSKKIRRQKRKVKKDRNEEIPVNEVLVSVKQKLWAACKLGDIELLSSAVESLLTEIRRCQVIEEQISKEQEQALDSVALITMDDVIKLVNDPNTDGNTMLHMVAAKGYVKLVWSLLEIGSDPCNKNKKRETPYVTAADKETRNTFRRFMCENPEKFNYDKSRIPGPMTVEMEQEILEKKKEQRRAKRKKEKMKKKEFEIKKQEEEARQRFLHLSDREKRALAAENRIRQQGGKVETRCFQCGSDMSGKVPFEYNANRFCSMPCLKEHRLRHKAIL
ncbi:ankyrin repeat and zinc finger domain-containing protein 1 [Cephus cinctus]|uniref:Ankyrin repeat and zinc finger domain-containing protein 1 n=1 Tax=Cephus cinctus TaxID=211228 RepID=A0AAJ7RSI9_CEPCN|nr:ankyrin repeat and zinc finger domain-containing protein 1 [Cephus cinctus]XP_024946362.1 ankyrin repeat and zinc finger domain-containing protein 1 [Cephus cinctus]